MVTPEPGTAAGITSLDRLNAQWTEKGTERSCGLFNARAAWHVMVLAAVMCAHIAPGAAQEATSVVADEPPQFGPNCSVCHGGDAAGTDRAPALSGNRNLRGQTEAQIAATISNGRGNMPAFSFLPASR